MNKKKLASSVAAVAAAAVILFSGTFAWQSINQTALNESSDIINPGGRLHDDFNGENKDIYVENFADEPIFARIRLSEFLALTANKGIQGAEKVNIILGGTDDAGERVYDIRYFHVNDSAERYWTWQTGGSTVYMPTFNRNKDSLAADINGTYAGPDGLIEPPNLDRYEDNKVYAAGDPENGTEIHDADANSIDEVGTDFGNLDNYVNAGNVVTLDAAHTAKATLDATLIGMSDWLAMVEADGYDAEAHGSCWVYDEDGWVYWSAPIQPGTATGLLLTGIELAQVMDDSWYYAIHVSAQFVTADDIGKSDHTGFYDEEAGSVPTEQAEQLLQIIIGQTP